MNQMASNVTIPVWLFGVLVTIVLAMIPALWRFVAGWVELKHRILALERIDEADSPQSRNRTIARVETLERKLARIENDEDWRNDVTPMNDPTTPGHGGHGHGRWRR